MTKITLGGKRLGAGNKQDIELHNYSRSTHNLKEGFKTAMACGTIVPFYCNIGLPGDTFDIDLNAMVRTIPTNGPLFGTFKLQLDMFQVPLRLYNGILHNNPLNIGMKMSQVKFPMLEISAAMEQGDTLTQRVQKCKTASNSLMKYLGISGMGTPIGGTDKEAVYTRKFNALMPIAYYDICKCYYANRMETQAYIIASKNVSDWNALERVTHQVGTTQLFKHEYNYDYEGKASDRWAPSVWQLKGWYINFYGRGLTTENIRESNTGRNLQTMAENGVFEIIHADESHIKVKIKVGEKQDAAERGWRFKLDYEQAQLESELEIQSFDLDNIDNLRYEILQNMQFDTALSLGSKGEIGDYLPYNKLNERLQNGANPNVASQNGLFLKTYQSDLFNNWVRTDWIDGANGIAEVTAVDTSAGNFKLDVLNLMQKVYNQLNRVAASGGTLEDWEEVTYGEDAIRRAESPIYMGGMSSEVVFEEVISTAQGDNGELGDLAGKGTLAGRKGGKVVIKPKEPVIIMGLVSITPRIDYSQGNAWYNTELESMEDLHKPAYDGIGFQELITEQMHWEDAELQNGKDLVRKSAGKVPAWINYMTAVDKAYSFFADGESQNFMVLTRGYEMEHDQNDNTPHIKDLTTYIDPRKFNYAFAHQDLDSQNFWVQIVTDVTARRKMSAKIIPNL